MKLVIEERVWLQIISLFSMKETEQGIMLGCSCEMYCIDCCRLVEPLHAEKCFYVPDTQNANMILRQWSRRGIAFAGFIHSHLTNKQTFSEDDMMFAEQLLRASKKSYLWYGLGVKDLNGDFSIIICKFSGGGRLEYMDYSLI